MSALPDPSLHSVLREIVLEHVFIGEVLRCLWQRNITDVEVLRSEFDAGGYDLVLARGALTRHIQLKTLLDTGKRAHFDLGLRLAARESGCVVVIVVDERLDITGFRWFGSPAGQALPDISSFPEGRHTKGDASGNKAARPAMRRVPLSRFDRVADVPGLLTLLLGETISI